MEWKIRTNWDKTSLFSRIHQNQPIICQSFAFELFYKSTRKSCCVQVLTFPFKTTEHLGVYETPGELASFLVKNMFDEFFEKTKSDFLKAVDNSDESKIGQCIQNLVDFRVCDPMIGSGIFIKEIINYLLEMRSWFIHSVKTSKTKIPKNNFLKSEQNFLEHILSHCLYGVELNKKNLEICKSFLENLLNDKANAKINFKQGNSLIDPLGTTLYDDFIKKNKKDVATLVNLRKKLQDRTIDSKELELLDKLKISCTNDLKKSKLFEKLPKKIMDDFFSWEIEFPEVFFDEHGNKKTKHGFDMVVGNPPWKILKPDDREFFENYLQGFSSMKKTERDYEKDKLLKTSDVEINYKSYLDSIKLYSEYFAKSGAFQLQGGRSHNFYKLSLEKFYHLSKKGGLVGTITPLGIATELGTSELRRVLLKECELFFIVGFEPKSKFFDNADVSPAVSMFKKGGNTKKFLFANGFTNISEVNLKAIPKISAELVQETSPVSMSIPSVKSKHDISILEKMYSFPTLGTILDGKWNVEFSRELDETNDRNLFREKKTTIPLFKGTNIRPFGIKKPPFIWVDEKKFKKISKDYKFSRVVWRDVARPNLKNRLVATLIPAGSALGNSLNYIKPNISEPLKYFLLGFLNSSIAEYRIRQLTSNSHINQFVIKQLPVPRLSTDDITFKKISKLSMDLCMKKTHDENEKTIDQIDKLFAKLYGLSEGEYLHIKEHFT